MNHDQVDKLINIYLDEIVSVSRDCGWRGDGIMAKYIEFSGQIPRSTGNVVSNLSMVNSIEGLAPEHPDFPKICAIVQYLLHDADRMPQIRALLASHFYRGLVRNHVDPDTASEPIRERNYDDSDRAEEVNQTLAEYRFNVKAGRRWVKKLWEGWA